MNKSRDLYFKKKNPMGLHKGDQLLDRGSINGIRNWNPSVSGGVRESSVPSLSGFKEPEQNYPGYCSPIEVKAFHLGVLVH